MKKAILLTIYEHPDKFPPTLNAIRALSKVFEKVIILYKDDINLDVDFPRNCIIYKISSVNLLYASIFIKIKTYLSFITTLLKISLKHKPDWLLAYDQYSFLACTLAKIRLKKISLWYHNHDITDLSNLKKCSLSWIAWKNEQLNLKRADLFTLPDLSRIKYFNFDENRTTFLEIPNYTSLEFNTDYITKKTNRLKVLYQGRVAAGHGIKELASFISIQNNMEVEFHIIGSYDEIFKQELREIIETYSSDDKVFMHNRLPHYHQLKDFTRNFDVGLGIMEPLNIQLSTCAKASNKIYEYISFGMPVILLDTDNFRNTLENYQWAFFTDMSDTSFKHMFDNIAKHYTDASVSAFNDYRTILNFESKFEQALEKLNL